MWSFVVDISPRKGSSSAVPLTSKRDPGGFMIEKNVAKALLTVPSKYLGDYQDGFPAGCGAFTFPRGQSITVAERVELGGPGKKPVAATIEPFIFVICP